MPQMLRDFPMWMMCTATDTVTLPYGTQTISLQCPWRCITMFSLVTTLVLSLLSFSDLSTVNLLTSQTVATALGVPSALEQSTPGYLLNACFEHLGKPTLLQTTFVTDYPTNVSHLAKHHRSRPRLVEWFELITVERELANSFLELTDPVEQRERVEAQTWEREGG